MSAPADSGASPPTPTASEVIAGQNDGRELDTATVYGARLLISDMRLASLLATEARQLAITRVFGVAPQDQSWLVTIVLCGSVAAVAWDALAKLVPHPTTADVKIGGSLLNMTARGLAGLPTRTMPLAGAVIALVLVSRDAREALQEFLVARRWLVADFRRRYGHLIGRPVAAHA
jgi:hypothetical protein